MTIAVAWISDRIDLYLPRAQASFNETIGFNGDQMIFDDRDHRHGLAGNARRAWEWALDTGSDYLLHLEEDFLFHEPVSLRSMQLVLDVNPHLAQVVLKRQPWNDQEAAAGGIVEMNPDAYTERHWGALTWAEHDIIFSLNPCLIPRRVLELGWPDGNEAEFTQTCLANGYRFAFYGGKFDPPRVLHVGAQRSFGWRL